MTYYKIHLFNLLFVAMISSPAAAQSFLEIGNKWIYETNDFTPGEGNFTQKLDSIVVEKDTIINGLTYFRLEASAEHVCGAFSEVEFLREEGAKIYRLSENGEDDLLIIDFEETESYNIRYDVAASGVDSTMAFVDSFNVATIADGQQIKAQYIRLQDDATRAAGLQFIVYENVGFVTNGLLFPDLETAVCDETKSLRLRCHISQNRTLHFTYEDCNEVLSTFRDTCEYLLTDMQWTYTKWSISCFDIFSKIKVVGDTLIGDILCSIVAVYDEGEFVEGSELILYNNDNKSVYFYEDGFKPLFDFRKFYDVGHIFHYYYPRNFAAYEINFGEGNPSDRPFRAIITKVEEETLRDGSTMPLYTTEPLDIEENGDDVWVFPGILHSVGGTGGFLGVYAYTHASGCFGSLNCISSSDVEYEADDGDCLAASTFTPLVSPVKIFPNPVSDFIHVEVAEGLEAFSIYDVSGRVIMNAQFRKRIDVSSLPAGVFILQLTDSEGTKKVGRFIKN